MAIKPRQPQTKVKHTILENYLKGWVGIIYKGVLKYAQNPSMELHFVYVDCNAYTGRYEGEAEEESSPEKQEIVFGSPIIAIKTLDALVKGLTKDKLSTKMTYILVEADDKHYLELKKSLDLAGLLHRSKETQQFESLKNGEIALLKGDSTEIYKDLLKYTQNSSKLALRYTFYFIDPYGPTGIPFEFVRDVVTSPRHDAIVYVPSLDLQRKAGIAVKDAFSTLEISLLDNYDNMFGTNYWRSIVQNFSRDAQDPDVDVFDDLSIEEDDKDFEKILYKLIEYYKIRLKNCDSNLVIKTIDLHFPNKTRSMYYLFLTTHDPTGALKMNQVIYNAGYQQQILKWRYKHSQKKGNQLEMFTDLEPNIPIQKRPSKEEIAEHIYSKLSNQTLSLGQVYKVLADEPYFADEVKKALRHLRPQKANWKDSDLRNSTIITFGP
jgi:three-Cys-motif partner protein